MEGKSVKEGKNRQTQTHENIFYRHQALLLPPEGADENWRHFRTIHSLGVRSIPTQYTKYIQQHWRLHMVLDPPELKQLHLLTKTNTFQTQTTYWNPQRLCWTKSVRTSVQDADGPQWLLHHQVPGQA